MKKKSDIPIDIDEIFLDSFNLPGFNKAQAEGQITKSLGRGTFVSFIVLLVAVMGIFLVRLYYLQIMRGEYFAVSSENNKLQDEIIFARRGTIYDRYGKKLAYNTPVQEPGSPDDEIIATEEEKEEDKTDDDKKKNDNQGEEKPIVEEKPLLGLPEERGEFAHRSYVNRHGTTHLVGYVRPPAKDKNGFFYRRQFEPALGAELTFNKRLTGKDGRRLFESTAQGQVRSANVIEPAQDGENVYLATDLELSNVIYKALKEVVDEGGYQGGAGVVMNVKTGEIVALVSYPEYDPEIMAYGGDNQKIADYNNDKRKVFLNRVVGGLYAPGSTVKPFDAYAFLAEKIIDPQKSIYSNGSLVLTNGAGYSTIFRDWRANGWADMRQAIAVSSNVYFQSVAGGLRGNEQMGIKRLVKWWRRFGFGQKTGIALAGEKEGTVPNPEWKKKIYNEDWNIGNTMHSAIGQYGWQATPLQLARAVGALVNGGRLLAPVLEKTDKQQKGKQIPDWNEDYAQIVREGMRETVYSTRGTRGTGKYLDMKELAVAAKTGTAERGKGNSRVNSWLEGFYPYEKPQYAFVVMVEDGSRTEHLGAWKVAKTFLNWIRDNRLDEDGDLE